MRPLSAVYMLRPPAMRMSALYSSTVFSSARGLPSSSIFTSSPISSRMRALSSSVDFLVPVATTFMPRSCSAEITDQDFTPPV
ncbi:hypothetical protein D9M71_602040 [compost metagenome]